MIKKKLKKKETFAQVVARTKNGSKILKASQSKIDWDKFGKEYEKLLGIVSKVSNIKREPAPKVGYYWNGHGGIYAGITRKADGDYHLILAKTQMKRDVIQVHASDWASSLLDGKEIRDFRLPTKKEAALLYANLQDHFEDLWYWTSDTYPPDEKCAWVQTFGYGRQADARVSEACRACAVRTERVE